MNYSYICNIILNMYIINTTFISYIIIIRKKKIHNYEFIYCISEWLKLYEYTYVNLLCTTTCYIIIII